jgi:hypothetical protein
MDLYEEICQGRSFSGECGKIQNIISQVFDILPTLLPSVFLLGRLQASYPPMI